MISTDRIEITTNDIGVDKMKSMKNTRIMYWAGGFASGVGTMCLYNKIRSANSLQEINPNNCVC